jgi:hypothetical protein
MGQAHEPDTAAAARAGPGERAGATARTGAAPEAAAGLAAGPAPSPTGRRHVLALQCSAGNAAVSRLLATGSPVSVQRQPSRKELLEQYEGDVAAGRWAHAAELLNGFNDADIAARVGALGPGQRTSMREACAEWNHRVRRPLLDLDFKAAVAAGRWPEAATLLNGFNDPDIAARVGALGPTQRIDLYVPGPDRIGDAIAAVDPDSAVQGAVRRPAPARAAAHLARLPDAKAAVRVAAMSDDQRLAVFQAVPGSDVRLRKALVGKVKPEQVIPWDKAPLAAAGEEIVFNEIFRHTFPLSTFTLVYNASGGGFDGVPGLTMKTRPGLMSGNVRFRTDDGWTGTPPISVRVEVQLSEGTVVHTESWVIGFKSGKVPTTITQEQGTGELPMGTAYRYQLGPDVGPPGHPDYLHQTILERFGPRTIDLKLADLKPDYVAANNLTEAGLLGHFAGDTGNVSTFTVGPTDQILDGHSGGWPDPAKLAQALVTPRDVVVSVTQTYEARPNVRLGAFLMRRITKANGRQVISKAPL